MKRWILASQAEQGGRLYWSTQRGWTYKELASLYREPTRETVLPISIKPDWEPIWFEVELDAGFVQVIEPKRERPDFAGGKDALNAIGDLANDVLWTPSKPLPDMLIVCRGYNVNVYRKAAS